MTPQSSLEECALEPGKKIASGGEQYLSFSAIKKEPKEPYANFTARLQESLKKVIANSAAQKPYTSAQKAQLAAVTEVLTAFEMPVNVTSDSSYVVHSTRSIENAQLRFTTDEQLMICRCGSRILQEVAHCGKAALAFTALQNQKGGHTGKRPHTCHKQALKKLAIDKISIALHSIPSQRSWPLWTTILIFLGVAAILGVTIGLLVHFLAVDKIYYYRGDFQISGVTYNNCENAGSQASTNLSKDIETKMLNAFQNSSIYEEYVKSEVIKLLPNDNGSNVQLQLKFKFLPAKRVSMRTKIKAILHQMLKDNMASWNAVPASIELMEISKAASEMLTNNCCGRQLANSIITGNKIVNGKSAQAGAWPWQASMQWKGRHYCGASLISSRWLLSAAHCFAKRNNSKYWTVNFGTVVNKPYMTRKVQNIIFHENYSSPGLHDDIALVQLAEEVSFTKYIRRICLPEAKMKLSQNDNVVVTGWGTLHMHGAFPVTLQEAFLKIIDNNICNAPYALSGSVTDTMLCAGFMSGEADACQNDSGGPLTYPDSRNIWHLVGIVSWGDGCGKKNKPGVYTRVTSYRDWITSKTGL
ncbi:transmembrane protease serine 11B [Saimiri boliviensis]|uniref:transmembrane protease serine 11B n=1 Tax=Saimiri boliviensis TaxID=27679 RepID=UPI003D77FCC4